jgi:glucose uptake protein GlcU
MNTRYKFLKLLVKQRKLLPVERLSNRLGYMGAGFMMTAPHLLPSKTGIVIYILAGLFCIPQVRFAKQWNLVLINLKLIIANAILFSK